MTPRRFSAVKIVRNIRSGLIDALSTIIGKDQAKKQRARKAGRGKGNHGSPKKELI